MTYKEYLSIAIPFMVSTVTQPLLGAVDTAVIGRLDDAAYIGGVAIGTVIFNTMYWVFGFLRVSTSGFSAQSLGSAREEDPYYAYFRPVLIATIISFIFIIIQGLIKDAAMHIYNPEPYVRIHATTYFNILIWGAPLVLIGYVNLGWLMGRKHVKESIFLQISTNLINIILDIIFVIAFKKGVAGVAYATLISQLYGFIIGIVMICKKMYVLRIFKYKANLLEKTAMKKILSVNRDFMIRTLCLLTMTNMFVAKGSDLGIEVLAANTVLFQVQYIMAYFYDGLGNASSVFTGKAVGENNSKQFKEILHIASVSAVVLGTIMASVVILFNSGIINLFTNLENVTHTSKSYIIWLAMFPIAACFGIPYEGIYTGATYTGPIRNSLIASLTIFITIYFTFIPQFENHGLWLAFILFSFGRSIVLFIYRNSIFNKVFVS